MTQFKLAAVVSALVVLAACDSAVTGNDGNLTFSYDADDNVFDFNKPIAIGAKLDITVAEAGTLAEVELSSATSSDEAVLAVDAFGGDKFTLEGLGDGNVLISVETTDGLTDSVNMNARAPEVLVLGHTCDIEGGAYLVGDQVYVPFEMEMTNGQPVIGYGYYPLTISDETKLTRDTEFNGQQFMRFDVVAAGTVTLTSDIDETTLDLTLAEEGQIDGITEPIAFVLEDIDVGDTNPFYVRPSVGGITMCQSSATVEVASTTPATCEVRAIGSDVAAGDAQYELGWFEIEGLAEGTCEYSVTYPNGAAGEGVTATFSYPIQP
jgi:hypothetical protein